MQSTLVLAYYENCKQSKWKHLSFVDYRKNSLSSITADFVILFWRIAHFAAILRQFVFHSACLITVILYFKHKTYPKNYRTHIIDGGLKLLCSLIVIVTSSIGELVNWQSRVSCWISQDELHWVVNIPVLILIYSSISTTKHCH